MLDVVFRIVHVFLHQPRVWFACRCVVLREVRVDEDIVEGDAFVGKCLENEIVDRPERVFRESLSAEAVLIGDHHKAEVELFANECEVAYDTRHEAKLVERVDLLVGRFTDDGAVAVDE